MLEVDFPLSFTNVKLNHPERGERRTQTMRSQFKTAEPAKKNRQAKKSNASKGPNSEELLQEIQTEAYFRFLNRGAQHGFDQEDWIEAEKEVRARYQVSSN
ncbi:MAG: hypothetical protein COV74_02355 [Candidatus Omnitrophica bacterium CG11_big_fil_rev_8_21_14_0_20_45_26]|uniref:DUF2934 domain-containing protein n=1 Tax=Candidatus Abzuiibacterium crystallinum TaxID=1974748 RepID=A0A2H0LRL8_9BACT|nr:MAG: hypothetical protein COV74_02355 [Candidatus Omnitrophica bacterium CG11_big_fil_rev_8_21_14_0_20_45_26]PIW64579.1 MAG: hypothetical protein COW12_05680 [Candidatus Omnitrophica bacterium CG12_big_fil_rev_8_21_14_0_65_45_16]